MMMMMMMIQSFVFLLLFLLVVVIVIIAVVVVVVVVVIIVVDVVVVVLMFSVFECTFLTTATNNSTYYQSPVIDYRKYSARGDIILAVPSVLISCLYSMFILPWMILHVDRLDVRCCT
jgi:c-di-AMP phosphodiesterase-like protein